MHVCIDGVNGLVVHMKSIILNTISDMRDDYIQHLEGVVYGLLTSSACVPF